MYVHASEYKHKIVAKNTQVYKLNARRSVKIINTKSWPPYSVCCLFVVDYIVLTQCIPCYSDYAVRAGLVEVPECTSLNNPVLHFRESSEQSVPRRSLVINGLALGCGGGTCRPTASVSGGMCV